MLGKGKDPEESPGGNRGQPEGDNPYQTGQGSPGTKRPGISPQARGRTDRVNGPEGHTPGEGKPRVTKKPKTIFPKQAFEPPMTSWINFSYRRIWMTS